MVQPKHSQVPEAIVKTVLFLIYQLYSKLRQNQTEKNN